MRNWRRLLWGGKKGKAPEPDGLPVEVYKVLASELIPVLRKLFNAAFLFDFELPESWKEANITLIPKPGKSLKKVESYRPISLLNADYKLFAKVIAERLNVVMPNLVHEDQRGFIKGRPLKELTYSLIGSMDMAIAYDLPLVVIALDAAKAFDRINWVYLQTLVKHLNLGVNFCKILKAIYKAPNARVLVNVVLTQPVQIKQGTRQGCPLSPLLFDLYIEPLARKIRSSQGIKPFEFHGWNKKIGLYADNILIFTTNLQQTMGCLLGITNNFGKVSGYGINKQKTEVMALNMQTEGVVCKKEIRYLGVRVTQNIVDLSKVNFDRVKKQISASLRGWMHLPLTIYGRVNLVKMMVLPKITFLFETIPLNFQKEWFIKLQSKISSFIWASKGPRLSWKKLRRRLIKGDLALPDLFFYSWAFLLKNGRMLIDVPTNSEIGRMFKEMLREEEGAEMGFMFKFADPKYFKKVRLKVLRSMVETGYRIRRVLKIPYLSWSAPIWDVPGSPMWTKDLLARPLKEAGILRWRQLFPDGHLVSWAWCEQELGSKFSRFKFLQIHSWHKALGEEIGGPNEFEEKLLFSSVVKKEIALWYWLLLETEDGAFTLPEDLWGGCLSETALEDQWQVSMSMLYKIVNPVYLRRNHFFAMHRAHWTPRRLSKFGPGGVVVCPKCGSPNEDDLHMFVHCSKIQTFWEVVSDCLSSILKVQIKVSVELIIYGRLDLQGSVTKDSAKLVFYAILLAHREICKLWVSSASPMECGWLQSMKYIAKLDTSDQMGKRH